MNRAIPAGDAGVASRLPLATQFAVVVTVAMPLVAFVMILANSDPGELALSWRFVAIPAVWSLPALLAVMAVRGRRPLFVACGVTAIVAGVTSFSFPMLLVFCSPALFAGWRPSENEVGLLKAFGAAVTALVGFAAAFWAPAFGATSRCWDIPHGQACSTGVILPGRALISVAMVAATVYACARLVPQADPAGPAVSAPVDNVEDPQG